MAASSPNQDHILISIVPSADRGFRAAVLAAFGVLGRWRRPRRTPGGLTRRSRRFGTADDRDPHDGGREPQATLVQWRRHISLSSPSLRARHDARESSGGSGDQPGDTRPTMALRCPLRVGPSSNSTAFEAQR